MGGLAVVIDSYDDCSSDSIADGLDDYYGQCADAERQILEINFQTILLRRRGAAGPVRDGRPFLKKPHFTRRRTEI